MHKGILGKKIGMTQIFDETGRVIPVTVIQAGPCTVIQKKSTDNDGYNALQIGFVPLKKNKATKPLQGHFDKAGVTPFRYLKELRLKNVQEYKIGQEIKADLFNSGEKVDITGISKGKGFAGSIKRHGFSRGPMKHGSKYHRGSGSLAAKGVARVFKGRRLPGHMGAEKVTTMGLEVIKNDPERNLLLVKGSVPGPRRGLLLIRNSVKGG